MASSRGSLWITWRERIALATLIAVTGLLLWFHSRIAGSAEPILWAVLFLAAALLSRRGIFRLFGPVLFYDLIRTARRNRYFLVRIGYALLLAFLLICVFLGFLERDWEIPASRMADAADAFFATFMYTQFIVVGLLTPAYTAGAIADEKDRRTLEFLLATDLHNREIVLSKLVSRLANLVLVVLTGLPVISILQLVGGIDPSMLLAGFAFTGLTMASLASLSILCSVYAKKPRDAIVLTYLTSGSYIGLSLMLLLLLEIRAFADFAFVSGLEPYTGASLVKDLNAGNLIYVLYEVMEAYESGKVLGDLLPGLLWKYAVFHGGLALVCAAWATSKLRSVALRQASGSDGKGKVKRIRRRRIPVGGNPMTWKEIHIESGLHLNWMGRILVTLLVIGSFVPPGIIIGLYLIEGHSRSRWLNIGDEMNLWVRPVGAIVACLMLLAVAVRAASSVGSERDKQTLDALLTSPLETNAILFGKWIGSIASVRIAWFWLGSVWLAGLVSGGLSLLALPGLLIAWFVYAAFVAGLGLWFSVTSKTTLRAIVWTLLSTTAAGVGHWLIWACCGPLLALGGGSGPGIEHVFFFQGFALTPPVTLGLIAFRTEEFKGVNNELGEIVVDVILGWIIFAGAAAMLYAAACARFRARTGRDGLRRPPDRVPVAIAVEQKAPLS